MAVVFDTSAYTGKPRFEINNWIVIVLKSTIFLKKLTKIDSQANIVYIDNTSGPSPTALSNMFDRVEFFPPKYVQWNFAKRTRIYILACF